jgi:hypothetical protein
LNATHKLLLYADVNQMGGNFKTLINVRLASIVRRAFFPVLWMMRGRSWFRCGHSLRNIVRNLKLNSLALVRERTIPTEQPSVVGEVSPNFF